MKEIGPLKVERPHVYGGIRTDANVVYAPFAPGNPMAGLFLLILPLAVIDFPASAAADTVLLSYTIPRALISSSG